MSKIIHGWEIVIKAKEYFGTPYRYGAEVATGEKVPTAWDCSEYVQFVLNKLGYEEIYGEPFPDGSANQYSFCARHGKILTVDEAFRCSGALVFMRNRIRGSIVHVGITERGYSIESRPNRSTCRWPRREGWTDAAQIPIIHY